MNLYELSSELALIHNEIIDAGGEITDELEKRLDGTSLDFKTKVENIGRWLVNISAKEEAVEKELARLTLQKKFAQNLQKRLKDYTKLCMEVAGKTKVEFPTMTVSLQRNPASVEIVDEEALPPKYIQIVQQKVIDKKAILEDLKGGTQVNGAALVTDKTHLRIR